MAFIEILKNFHLLWNDLVSFFTYMGNIGYASAMSPRLQSGAKCVYMSHWFSGCREGLPVFESMCWNIVGDEVQIYAQKEYSYQLVTAMLSKDVSSHISIPIDSMSLFESNITFAHYMFQNPRRALKLLDNAFQKVSLEISRTHSLKVDMTYRENLHVRLIALPNLPEVFRSSLPNCSDVGQFLCISGTVTRASTAKMLQYKKLWRCSKCKYQFIVEAEVELGYVCEKPLICGNPEWCNGKNFMLMNTEINTEWCKDYQEIKLQEQVYNLNVGTVPRSMWVVLEDDLVELCHPGNDVIVSGVLIQQWKPLSRSNSIDINLVILAHNIEVQNKMSSGIISKDMALEFVQFWQKYKSDPLNGRNFILSSICPQVFGLYIVKLAVALVLAGGVQKKSGSSRIRGDSHLLLIGDPGTAKSQFLKFATKVSSRSVLTSGIGTTNAGLTVSAVKESGRWQLEAGALVLADGGICCIDEFSCIKEQDKTCIHEAMEQQTISVAKAGLVCSLNTRCSILAATNPKGKYDESLSISENTALGSPLLSRFDIILVLLDTYDEEWDNMVSSYILDGRNIINRNSVVSWPIAKIKNYFTLIRHINPKVTTDAESVLRAYFTKQRSLQSRNASRTTPRLLQSLIRLAEGHARLMFRQEVLVIDAIIAIIVIESSMLGNSILEGLSPLHTVFPSCPTNEYIERAEKIFENLSIQLPIGESFESSYQDSTLKNLLADIAGIWNSKEIPYIFGSPPCESSFTSSPFQENSVNINDITTVEPDFGMPKNTDDLFHKNPYEMNYREESHSQCTISKNLQNDYTSITQVVHDKTKNEITSLSVLKNICDISDTAVSQNELDCNTSKNVDNFSILQQVLEEPDFLDCPDSKPTYSKNNEKSSTENIFNMAQASTSKCNLITNPLSKDLSTFVQNSMNPRLEGSNNDILQKLGISDEERMKGGDDDNIASSVRKCSDSLSDKSASPNNILFKSNQLKNFAFSGFKKKVTVNEAGSSSNLQENKTEVNRHVAKKLAFKMIVEKSKSSQS